VRHRHSGPSVRYKTRRGNTRYRNRPMHKLTMKGKERRRGSRRMAWDIEGANEEAHRIEYMTPREYMEITGLDPDNLPEWMENYFDTETQKSEDIHKLGEHIKSEEDLVTLPWVGDRSWFSTPHEGRHRAYAAMLEGEEEIPVAVPLAKDERKELAEEFIQRAFPDSDNTYQDEWRERFSLGLPEQSMDKERRQILKEILDERDIKEPE